MRNRALFLVPLVAAVCGCGGNYTLTVGDHLAVAGEEAPVVVRLQRNDFFVLNLAVSEAAMRLRVGDGLERGAYTDTLGYAATTVPVPSQTGRYPLHADHMDFEGQEVGARAAMYVWDADRPAVAVDIDSLPPTGADESHAARAALNAIAKQANILYLTSKATRDHARLHEQLQAGKYPDGPILMWQRQQWRVVRDEKLKVPRVVVEDRLVSQLPQVRGMLPQLKTGIAATAIAARAFCDADMRAVLIGQVKGECPQADRVDAWADLARQAAGSFQ